MERRRLSQSVALDCGECIRVSASLIGNGGLTISPSYNHLIRSLFRRRLCSGSLTNLDDIDSPHRAWAKMGSDGGVARLRAVRSWSDATRKLMQ